MKHIMRVEGMSCNHCVQTIQKAVGGLAGVRQVTVNLGAKEVAVEFDEQKTGLAQISAAITEAGFEVVK